MLCLLFACFSPLCGFIVTACCIQTMAVLKPVCCMYICTVYDLNLWNPFWPAGSYRSLQNGISSSSRKPSTISLSSNPKKLSPPRRVNTLTYVTVLSTARCCYSSTTHVNSLYEFRLQRRQGENDSELYIGRYTSCSIPSSFADLSHDVFRLLHTVRILTIAEVF